MHPRVADYMIIVNSLLLMLQEGRWHQFRGRYHDPSTKITRTG